MIKVRMSPALEAFGDSESGIRRVLEAYYKHLPKVGIEIVDSASKSDVVAIHAGMIKDYEAMPTVAHLHGLYWTADYVATEAESMTNANVIVSAIIANVITVPSNWVAETIKRDMHASPVIVPHGIDVSEWTHSEENLGYVLWNKNRVYDVCTPDVVGDLAALRTDLRFVSTFRPKKSFSNISICGIQPHNRMKKIVQSAGVYLSTTKETFGIGTLEAMAAGVPVLGWANGGNMDIVEHGVTGYLAAPGDLDDLANGLEYCVKFRKTLGRNSSHKALAWDWGKVANILAGVYELAIKRYAI